MPGSSARPREENAMNIHPTIQKRTPAEDALVASFEDRFSRLPGDPEVSVKRDAAIEQLKAGLPTRHVEAWHYTDLRRLLTHVPESTAAKGGAVAVEPLLDGSVVTALFDGVHARRLPTLDGVKFEAVADKLSDGSLAPALGASGDDDAVGALNTALVGDGVFVDVSENTSLEVPIEIQNIHTGGQTHTRNAVRVGNGASAIVIERQTGTNPALVSHVSNLSVGDGAEVTWVIVQEQPDTVTHLAQFNAYIGANAKLTLFVMNAGGKLVRQEIKVKTVGEGSDFQLRGVNLLAGDTHSDTTMVLDHAVPHCGSRELVRNVVTGKARGVFQGRINVHQIAQKTDAKMACNTLLLSDDAEFLTKPELEIFADDVACGHGATVTEIDRNHLFYLMARGVPEKEGRGMLVKAFLAEVIEELEHPALVEALEAKLDEWFRVNV
ncbi:Fe-S cluster assembly protein SufD [Mesorhizobium sp. RP14(2022)]|uniref:Fe-S cluster assembly protein SufD n=1 Tax=Mesorhizobium liriopis TaxID=2953882 RepID=A0ABT1C464_9HYPH|nr:Fe-S cluster assembly protein SufD [Mesorhizobium liriopis]MCO6048741.1 Fe-S cluster assembly protein SufD [Mesorhizobium liriopis]